MKGILQAAFARRRLALTVVCLLMTLKSGGVMAQTNAAPGCGHGAGERQKNHLLTDAGTGATPRVAHSHWGGAYLRTRFTGTSVGINMADGEPGRQH